MAANTLNYVFRLPSGERLLIDDDDPIEITAQGELIRARVTLLLETVEGSALTIDPIDRPARSR